MKMIKIWCLGLFALAGIVSIIIVIKLIVVDGVPEKVLYSQHTLQPKVIVQPELAKDSVEIKIGGKKEILEDVFVILVEKKGGEVKLFSSEVLDKFQVKHSSHDGGNNPIVEGNNSLQNLMLQTATGSNNAYASICCTGPYVNASGDVVPRSCVKKNSACN